MQATTIRDRLLIVYSAADVAWAMRLRPLVAQRFTWWPDELEVGGAVDSVVLARASVVLVLMAPEVAAWRELPALLEEERGLAVVWVPVRPSGSNPVGRRRALLNPDRPLEQMESAEASRALDDVALQVAEALRRPTAEDQAADLRVSRFGFSLEDLERAYPPRRVSRGPAPRRPTPVHLGASAPRIVKPGQEFTARFAAYHPKFARAVRRRLCAAGLRPQLGLGEALWRRGTEVTVQLSGDALEVAPTCQRFTWGGEHHVLDFDVRARERGARFDTRLRFDVSIEGVVIARLPLGLTVAEPRRRGRASPERSCYTYLIAPRTAFASYASEDRARVLDRIAAIWIAAGMEVFLDCLSLRASEQWRDRLAEEISQREVFMLFWSEFAASSKWVEWEWRQALAHKGLNAIQPHPLDPWPKAPLPAELSSIHMGDPLMAVREASLKAGSRDRTAAPEASPLPSRA